MHLKEVALELLVDMVVFKLVVHPDIAVKTPVPIFVDCLVQSCVGHRGSLEQLQKPVRRGHDHVVVVAIIVGSCINLLDPEDLVRAMLLKESCNATIRELLDPVSGLPHPILNGDGEAWATAIAVKHVPLRALFSRESGTVVDETCPEELKLFPLSVALLGPLLVVFFVFAFTLFEGLDEAMGNVGNRVKVVSDLDGGGSSAW